MIDSSILFHRAPSDSIKPDMSELFRYAGYEKKDIPNIENSIQKTAEEAEAEIASCMNCRAVYIRFPLQIQNADNDKKKLIFSHYEITSHNLGVNLTDCTALYLFAATLGPAPDKAIQKANRLNPVKAVFLQAAGAMYIEQYCDLLQATLEDDEKKSGNVLVPRYSPGYGDVPLTEQKTFFEILQCQKNLALTLNNSLIMSPEKSVTAFIGIKKHS